MKEDGQRVKLGSRLGFLMLAAGCAVGLGNVWRFPFVVGENGGAVFVLVYLLFLSLMGFPLLTGELALGRAIRPLAAASFGTYLAHMLVLVPVLAWIRPHFSTPVTMVLSAFATFVLTSLVSIILGRIPFIGRFMAP